MNHTSSNKHNDKETPNNTVPKEFSYDSEHVEKGDFAKFIREQRKEYNDAFGTDLSTEDLGNILGIDYEVFRKILNREKPTNKRDCIIAICVALRMIPGDIDEALGYYQYMPPLDDKYREGYIKELIAETVRYDSLSKKHWSHITLEQLNHKLALKEYPVLDVHDGRKRTKKKESAIKYKIIRTRVNRPIDLYYGDRYNSLSTKYSPYDCICTGEMHLQEIKNRNIFILSVDSFGKLSSRKYRDIDGHFNYDDINETGVFKEYFEMLISTVNAEKQRLLDLLNDTKNYSSRTSARVIDDALCVFIEEYNYSFPEFNEYYVLSRSRADYTLNVYDRSCFMQYYLSPEEYEKYYNNTMLDAKETYHTLAEIDSLIKKTDRKTNDYSKLLLRKRTFEKLRPSVDELYGQIVNQEVYILNPDYCIENPYEILTYFDVEADFKCEYDETYGEICNSMKRKKYSLPDGQKVTISLDDLYEGFELGIRNIDDICRIKNKYGKIRKIL